MNLVLPALLAATLAVVAWLSWRARQRGQGRQRAIRGVLDAVAGDHENPVRGAMQEILRQRLWLQDNAGSADLAQLDAVRRTLESARTSLEQQLQRVSQARAGH